MGRKRSVPMLFNACHRRMLKRNTGQNIRIMGLTPATLPEDSLGGTIFFMLHTHRVPMRPDACSRRMLKRNAGQNIRIMGLTPGAPAAKVPPPA
jgi:hypothetical protein